MVDNITRKTDAVFLRSGRKQNLDTFQSAGGGETEAGAVGNCLGGKASEIRMGKEGAFLLANLNGKPEKGLAAVGEYRAVSVGDLCEGGTVTGVGKNDGK